MQFMNERSLWHVTFIEQVYSDKLNNHIESNHEGKEPFKCNDCGVGFSLKGNLNRHIESVHEGKKLLKCNDCGTGFSQNEIWINILNQFMKKQSLPSYRQPSLGNHNLTSEEGGKGCVP